MNGKGKLIALFIAFFCLVLPMSHAVWTFEPLYSNVINVTVANWSYVNGNFNYPAKTALVSLNKTGDPTLIKIDGYSNSLQNLGSIQFAILQQKGNVTEILLNGVTNESLPWAIASIFYNPVTSNVCSAQAPLVITTCSWQAFPSLPFSFDGQSFTLIGFYSNSTASKTSITPFYSNTILANFSLSLNASFVASDGMLVVLANRSLVSRSFNLSWRPTYFINYTVNASAGRYKLASHGLLGSTVSNAPISSSHSNTIFIGATDGIGFEAWLATVGNQIYSEGMGKFTTLLYSDIYNATLTTHSGLSPSTQTQTLNISVSANIPTQYMILPAFTTNVILSSRETNPTVSNQIAQPSDFSNWIPIRNIVWQYNFSTYAFPSSPKPSGLLSFNVPASFLIINTTHYYTMGQYCGSVYMEGYLGTVDVGAVPFYILNCTTNGAQPARFLLQNTTVNDETYNAVNVYYNYPPLFLSSGFSNSIVLDNWQFEYGSYFTFNGMIGGLSPFVIQTSLPIASNSFINETMSLAVGDAFFSYSFGTRAPFDYPYQQIRSNAGLIPNINMTNNTYLEAFNVPESITGSDIAPDVVFVTRYLAGIFCQSCGADGVAVTGIMNQSFFTKQIQATTATGLVTFNIRLNDNTAAARYTWTNIYKTGGIQTSINSSCNPFCPGLTNPITPLNTSGGQNSTSRNYSKPTTTINFNSNSITMTYLGGNSLLPIPTYLVYIIAIIFVIIGAALFAVPQIGHFPFILILIGVWFAGLTNYTVLIIALIATIIFVVEEFVDRKAKTH